jgi:hypothetical protein
MSSISDMNPRFALARVDAPREATRRALTVVVVVVVVVLAHVRIAVIALARIALPRLDRRRPGSTASTSGPERFPHPLQITTLRMKSQPEREDKHDDDKGSDTRNSPLARLRAVATRLRRARPRTTTMFASIAANASAAVHAKVGFFYATRETRDGRRATGDARDVARAGGRGSRDDGVSSGG